ncbi:MAG: hypothetical protein AW07_02354 [Candidatus Accumulibacter sp. SK-11]|nr:MAG: hypothetical protein AW07_02354 [Candidatus Accumulibacter sp. SK-11]
MSASQTAAMIASTVSGPACRNCTSASQSGSSSTAPVASAGTVLPSNQRRRSQSGASSNQKTAAGT